MDTNEQTKNMTLAAPSGPEVMTKRERRILQNAIERLPTRQEKALYMRVWYDVSINHIGIFMNIDWEEAHELVQDGLMNIEHDLVKRKLKIEEYPFLFKTLEEVQ